MTKHKLQRRGASLLELVVAGSLLVTGLSVVSIATVSAQRLKSDGRQYRVATDELNNQLEQLLNQRTTTLAKALSLVQPSEFANSQLPNAKLSVKRRNDEFGDRLIAQLEWDRPGKSKALVLVGWIRSADLDGDSVSAAQSKSPPASHFSSITTPWIGDEDSTLPPRGAQYEP